MTHRIRRDTRGGGLHTALRMCLAIGGLGGLAACASQAPTIPATQEAAEYRAHAHNYYHPPGPAWDPWGPYIKEAAERFDVPETWIRAVMHQESGGQEFAVSTPGAMGLMQVMPFTYDLMREQYSLEDDPYDPRNNVLAGTAYIRQMYDIYGSPGFLAAYNAGPGRLDDFLTRNRPLPAETRHYVANIGPEIAFDSPHNRSQADLMAMNHANGGYAVASSGGPSPLDPALQHSVQLAWARRGDDSGGASEVAEAPPVSTGGASGVRAAWASREARAPMQVASAPISARGGVVFEPAPTPRQAAVVPAEQDPEALASARIVSPPSAELADSVAEAPEPAAPRTRHARFRFVEPAVAETVPWHPAVAHGAAGGHWSIQVGAFGSPNAAHEAAGSARSQQAGLLGHAHAEVASVHDRHGKLYRARLTGLSREAAMRACQHLGRCVVVSPDGEI